jgi:plastocyanin
MRRMGLLALGGAALALLAGGCGSGPRAGGANAQIASPVATINVNEKEFSLDPANPKVPRSGLISIVATNSGTEYHALRVVVPGGGTSEGARASQEAATQISEIDPGDTRTLNLVLKPGTYTWYCPLSNHRRLGMRGKIKVL